MTELEDPDDDVVVCDGVGVYDGVTLVVPERLGV